MRTVSKISSFSVIYLRTELKINVKQPREMNPLYFLVVGVFLFYGEFSIFIFQILHCILGGVDSFKIDESVDVSEVRPCKNAEEGYTSCYSLLVDTKTLRDNIINLPSGANNWRIKD